MGAGKQQPLIAAVDALELDSNGIGAMAAVQARLARRKLPTVDSDGLVEYAQLALTSASSGSRRSIGTDVDWIESAASGSGMTFRAAYNDRQLNQSMGDDDLSARKAHAITPRRHPSAGKNLSKMPWERDNEEVDFIPVWGPFLRE